MSELKNLIMLGDIEMSGEVAELFTALAVAQGKIENPAKNRKGYNYTYADLPAVQDVSKKALAEQGIAIIQMPGATHDNEASLTTLLTHKSGQWIKSRCTLPLGKMTAQDVGAAITYARRYALTAILNICADEDTDAEGLGEKAPTKTTNHSKVSNISKMITEGQVRRLFAIGRSHNWSDEELKELVNNFGYESSKDILVKDYDKIVSTIGQEKRESLPEEEDIPY